MNLTLTRLLSVIPQTAAAIIAVGVILGLSADYLSLKQVIKEQNDLSLQSVIMNRAIKYEYSQSSREGGSTREAIEERGKAWALIEVIPSPHQHSQCVIGVATGGIQSTHGYAYDSESKTFTVNSGACSSVDLEKRASFLYQSLTAKA